LARVTPSVKTGIMSSPAMAGDPSMDPGSRRVKRNFARDDDGRWCAANHPSRILNPPAASACAWVRNTASTDPTFSRFNCVPMSGPASNKIFQPRVWIKADERVRRLFPWRRASRQAASRWPGRGMLCAGPVPKVISCMLAYYRVSRAEERSGIIHLLIPKGLARHQYEKHQL